MSIRVISGRQHIELSKKIAQRLTVPLTNVEIEDFANGEIFCRIGESVRGDDVFVIQTHSEDVNKAILEQAIIVDAAKRASATSITAVCPFMAYARQDRKSAGREPITARLVVDILTAAGADRIISVDLHTGQIQGFMDGPFDHIVARPALVNYLQENFDTSNMIIVSPDAGRVKSAEQFSNSLSCDMAIIYKTRSANERNQTESKRLMGSVSGKTCFVVDDMIDTGGTICAAADLISSAGAKEVYGLTTHGLLSGDAIKRIEKSSFIKIIVTDTVPVKLHQKIEVVSVADLIADAMYAVYSGGSVSALFDGQNQH